MKIEDMDLGAIETRKAEIGKRLSAEDITDTEVTELDTELDALNVRKAAVEGAIQTRAAAVAKAVASPIVLRSFPGVAEAKEERAFDAASPEYRSAWLKNLAHNPRTGEWKLGELTDVEKRAFTFTTATTPDAVPTSIPLGIVDMISKKFSILGDLNPTSFGGVVEFLQATPRVAGAAAETSENVANANDLNITFTAVTMTGVEIKGQVKISAKMRIQSMDGFEAFLINDISQTMGECMNLHVVDAIEDDMAVANVISCATLDDAHIREAFGQLKGGSGTRVVYANGYTIWNEIAAVEADDGQKLFIPSTLDSDPTIQGRVYGSAVKLDDTLDDGDIFIGYPSAVKANMFVAPNVMSDMPDVTTREMVYGGYALFEARLGDTRAWAKLIVAAVS